MSDDRLTDPTPGVTLGASRTRVLDAVRAGGEVGVQDVATRLGLHRNTARFHLDGLVAEGLLERAPEARSRPGRPRTVYRVAAEEQGSHRSYRLLAEMLTGLAHDLSDQPGLPAAEAGEKWGRYLAERPAPLEHVDAADGIRQLSKVLDDVGFAPGPVAEQDGAATAIPLRHCPFREIAVKDREVVCSLHLGLMRGVLRETGAPVGVARLEPFVEPSLCVATLTGAASSEG
jgi:predicted ArsR family transcriptional regulator